MIKINQNFNIPSSGGGGWARVHFGTSKAEDMPIEVLKVYAKVLWLYMYLPKISHLNTN